MEVAPIILALGKFEDLFHLLCKNLSFADDVPSLVHFSMTCKKTMTLIELPTLWSSLLHERFFCDAPPEVDKLLGTFPGGPKTHFQVLFSGIHKNKTLAVLEEAKTISKFSVVVPYPDQQAFWSALPPFGQAYLCCLGKTPIVRSYAIDAFFQSMEEQKIDLRLWSEVTKYILVHEKGVVVDSWGQEKSIQTSTYQLAQRSLRVTSKLGNEIHDVMVIHGPPEIRKKILLQRYLSDLTNEEGHEFVRNLVAEDYPDSLQALARYRSESDVPFFLEKMKEMIASEFPSSIFLSNLWPHPEFLPLLLQMHDALRNNFLSAGMFTGIYPALQKYKNSESEKAISEFIHFLVEIPGISESHSHVVQMAACLVYENLEEAFLIWEKTGSVASTDVMERIWEKFGDQVETKLQTSIGTVQCEVASFFLQKLREPLRTDWAVRFFSNPQSLSNSRRYCTWLDKNFPGDISPFIPQLRQMNGRFTKDLLEKRNISLQK